MPLVSKTFDQLLDFTRTSSATFVGSNGLIQTTPASVNLLTQTQQFDNATWSKSNATVTANSAVAPDGTSTADKLVETATSGAHSAGETVTVLNATVYTASAYVKAAERTFVAMYAGTPGQGTIFNLSNGTVHGPLVAPPTSSSITAAGNGWYRVTITYTSTSTSTAPSLYLCDGTAQFSYTGDGTSGAYVWGAQLEAASAATTYTRNNGGVFPPRFDYDPVTLAPKGLLIEEQRTNLLIYSEDLTNAVWTKGGATVAANATTAPDGTTNADKLEETTANSGHYAFQSTTCAAGAHTASIFVKAAERTWCILEVGTPLDCAAWFNLSTGTVGTQSGSPSSVTITAVGNGWWRITMTKTAGSAGTPFINVYPSTGDGVSSYAGTAGSGIYIWGAQFEAGAFATSYIPTVASQVTRTADICSIVAPNFAPWYNQSEGTIVAEAQPISVSDKIVFSVSNSSGYTNSIVLAAGGVDFYAVSGGATQAVMDAGTWPVNAIRKLAGAYKASDFAASLGGAAAVAYTTGSPPTVDRAFIGGLEGNTANRFNGHIRSIRYYPTRLTNAQLQALTA